MAIGRKSLRMKPAKKIVPEMYDGMCTIKRAAEFLSCSTRTIEKMIDEGLLESVKLRRARRISWESVLRYAGKAPRQPTPQGVEQTSKGTIIHVDANALRDVIREVVREVLRAQGQ